MKSTITQLINSLNYYFDKTPYIIKERRSLNSLAKSLIYNSEKYKEKINIIQELYSSKKTKVIIDRNPQYCKRNRKGVYSGKCNLLG